MKPVATFVAGRADEAAYARVVLAVRIREIGARTAELLLELALRVDELPAHLVVAEFGEMSVGDTVGAELDAAFDMGAELIPGHRRELGRIVAGKLGNRERCALARVAGAHEDLNRHPQSLECRKNARRGPERVVEACPQAPEACEQSNLPHEQVRLDREPVLPRR